MAEIAEKYGLTPYLERMPKISQKYGVELR
jgi:hypothetical protein